jgi:hypothetical protein
VEHPSQLQHVVNCFVAVGPAMAHVYALVQRYAPARTPLLLVGATGTGKTTVAELVHALGGRAGPFVAHTARELDPNLERSQLFGHEKGAFTGAGERHVGWLEEAGAGTLLLDDFHHVRRGSQMALLRALDRGAYRPLNARRDLPMRCRVIVGLEDGPDALLAQGRLIAELRYRLGFCEIGIPPLRERREEIASLAQRFLELCAGETGMPPGPTRFAPDVIPLLECPGVPVAPPETDVGRNVEYAHRMAMHGFVALWFRNMVTDGGPWDPKKDGHPEWDPFGNFNYGATGAAAHFSLETLLRMSGWAAEQFDSGRSHHADLLRALFGDPYTENSDDRAAIRAGYQYYQNRCHLR